MQELPYIDNNFSIAKFIDSLPIRKINTLEKIAFYACDVAKLLDVGTKVIARNCEPHHIFSPDMITKYNVKTYRTNGRPDKKLVLLTEQGLYHVLSTIGYNPLLAQYRRWLELNATSERMNSDHKITLTAESSVKMTKERKELIKSILSHSEEFNELKTTLTIFQINNDPFKACQENLHHEDEDEVDMKLRIRDKDEGDEVTVHSVRALQKCWENYPSLKPHPYRYKIVTNASHLDFSSYETKYRIHCKSATDLLMKVASRMTGYAIDCKDNNIFECDIECIKEEFRRAGEKCIWEDVIVDVSVDTNMDTNMDTKVCVDAKVRKEETLQQLKKKDSDGVYIIANLTKEERKKVDPYWIDDDELLTQYCDANEDNNDNDDDDDSSDNEDNDSSDNEDNDKAVFVDNDRYPPGEKPSYTHLKIPIKTNVYELPDTNWYLDRAAKNELGF